MASAVGPVARNDATEWFFDGTARGEFLLLGCPNGHANQPQAKSCRQCSSTDLSPFAASGQVSLVSWAVVPERPRPGVEPGPPAMPAIIEFAEGPWWWGPLVDADPEELRAGMDLEIRFERPGNSEAVPVFAPRREEP